MDRLLKEGLLMRRDHAVKQKALCAEEAQKEARRLSHAEAEVETAEEKLATARAAVERCRVALGVAQEHFRQYEDEIFKLDGMLRETEGRIKTLVEH